MVAGCRLVGLDWGITTLRAYALGDDGAVLDTRTRNAGIMHVGEGGFEGAFSEIVSGWPRCPVLASGMITSRQGWVEVPYVPCPCGVAELAAGLVRRPLADGRDIYFVPGAALRSPDGGGDVMRGEETQIAGVDPGPGQAAAVLPGTHSKWALLDGGALQWFVTFMTGELFAVLKEHSILGRMMYGGTHDAAAFASGVARGAVPEGADGGLLKRLFSARTLALFGALDEAAVESWLSGLMIGAEIREAQASLDAFGGGAVPHRVVLIGGGAAAARYADALAQVGIETVAAAGAAPRGHWRIARQGNRF